MGRFFKLLGPAVVGSAGVQLAMFADTIIASTLPTGALSALYYAERLYQLPLGVVGIAAGTVLLPEMTRRIAGGDVAGAYVAQNRAIGFTLALAAPCAVAFIVLPDLILSALFQRGAFDAGAVQRSAAVLTLPCDRPAGGVILRSVTASFYSRHDTATPLWASFAGYGVNIALKILLIGRFGVVGLALATSVGAWTNVAILWLPALRRGYTALAHAPPDAARDGGHLRGPRAHRRVRAKSGRGLGEAARRLLHPARDLAVLGLAGILAYGGALFPEPCGQRASALRRGMTFQRPRKARPRRGVRIGPQRARRRIRPDVQARDAARVQSPRSARAARPHAGRRSRHVGPDPPSDPDAGRGAGHLNEARAVLRAGLPGAGLVGPWPLLGEGRPREKRERREEQSGLIPALPRVAARIRAQLRSLCGSSTDRISRSGNGPGRRQGRTRSGPCRGRGCA